MLKIVNITASVIEIRGSINPVVSANTAPKARKLMYLNVAVCVF